MLVMILKIAAGVFIGTVLLLLYGIWIERYLVRIPLYGIPMLPVKNKEYSSGQKTSPNGRLVLISKGIGWGIFPGRLNCFPEIPIIELLSVNEPILSGGIK